MPFFLAARSIPGVAYESMEVDEDGFVDTTGGVKIGGLFRSRKSKAAEPVKAPEPVKPDGEPNYLDDTARRSVPLKGSGLVSGSGFTVQRLDSTDESGNPVVMFLLLEVKVEN